MKDFNELYNQINEDNLQQRQALVQSIQPFFNALFQKREYDEQYARSQKEAADKAIKYNSDLRSYMQSKGLEMPNIDPQAAPEIQQAAVSEIIAEKNRGADMVNRMQQAGFGAEYEQFIKDNPGMDIDVAFGKIAEKMSDKEIDQKAEGLGTAGTKIYNDLLAKGATKRSALGDALRAVARADTKWEVDLKTQAELQTIYARSAVAQQVASAKAQAQAQAQQNLTDAQINALEKDLIKQRAEAVRWNKGVAYNVTKSNGKKSQIVVSANYRTFKYKDKNGAERNRSYPFASYKYPDGTIIEYFNPTGKGGVFHKIKPNGKATIVKKEKDIPEYIRVALQKAQSSYSAVGKTYQDLEARINWGKQYQGEEMGTGAETSTEDEFGFLFE